MDGPFSLPGFPPKMVVLDSDGRCIFYPNSDRKVREYMNIIRMILLSVLVATGCHASPAGHDPGAGKSKLDPVSSAKVMNDMLTIRFDQTASSADIELRWLKIMDSRCPTGVNCIRAGDVKVILEATNVKEGGSKPVEFELTLYVRGKPATASVFGYELELLSVHPYPVNNVTPKRGNYVAEIKISEAAQK